MGTSGKEHGAWGQEGKQGKSKAHGVYHMVRGMLRTAWSTWRMGQGAWRAAPGVPACLPAYLSTYERLTEETSTIKY